MSQTRPAGAGSIEVRPREQCAPDVLGVLADFETVRARSLALTAPLEIEDYGLQPMADASPAKWHLAHTTWFFETFILRPFAADYVPLDSRYEYLFNSYYNGIGEQFPRARRGDLSRPTVREVFAYRAHVDDAMARLLRAAPEEAVRARTVLGCHHEQQHQELLLTDLKYAFGHNPLRPAHGGARAPAPARDPGALTWTAFPGGRVEIGVDAPPAEAAGVAGLAMDAFVFDNETPAHDTLIAPFEIADRCITSGEYLEFMAAGGYESPELWLADGWSWLRGPDGPRAPLYWRQEAGTWFEYTLAGERPLDLHAPVTHVSFYEVDAYARWAGARLPTEAEWEHAARSLSTVDAADVAKAADAAADGFAEDDRFHPAPAMGTSGLRGMLGHQWEWTASPYAPYAGFRPAAGALGEYNGKFMCNQLVLRGASCATPRRHARATYRNFFYPSDRWQFTGVRLARHQ